MRARGKAPHHAQRLLHISGLGEWIAIDIDKCIRTEHQFARSHITAGDGLATRIFNRERFGA